MAINPYQLANIEITRDEQSKKLLHQQKAGQADVRFKKGTMKRQFQDELKAAMDRYKRKTKKGFFEKAFGGGLGKLLDNPFISTLLLSGVAPVWGGLVAGGKSLGQQKMLKEAAMDLPEMGKWKNTFLRDPAMEAETTIEGIKDKAEIDPLQAVTSGLTSYVLSDALGGKEMDAKGKVVEGAGKVGLFKGEGKFLERLFKKLNPTTMKGNLAASNAAEKAEMIKLMLAGSSGDTNLLDALTSKKAQY